MISSENKRIFCIEKHHVDSIYPSQNFRTKVEKSYTSGASYILVQGTFTGRIDKEEEGPVELAGGLT